MSKDINYAAHPLINGLNVARSQKVFRDRYIVMVGHFIPDIKNLFTDVQDCEASKQFLMVWEHCQIFKEIYATSFIVIDFSCCCRPYTWFSSCVYLSCCQAQSDWIAYSLHRIKALSLKSKACQYFGTLTQNAWLIFCSFSKEIPFSIK